MEHCFPPQNYGCGKNICHHFESRRINKAVVCFDLRANNLFEKNMDKITQSTFQSIILGYLGVIGFGCKLGDFSPDIPLHPSHSHQCKAPLA